MTIAESNTRLRKLRFLSLLLVATLAVAAPVTAGLLEDVFSPLRDLDIPSFYSSYSTVIDAIIFCLIFMGLAQVTLGKRFGESRGAKAIVVGVGLALTFALVIMERTMDFSLAQFGPYAAAIFVILAASVLFYLLKTLGVGGLASFSGSYVIVYFLLRAVVPSFFHYIQLKAPGLHGLIALGALVSLVITIWKLVANAWPGAGEKIGRIRARIKPTPEEPLEAPESRAELGEELKLLRGKLAEIQRQRVKDSEAIMTDLDNIIFVIDRYGDTPQSRHLIAEKLSQDVVPREHRLKTSLRALRKLHARVQKFELGMLAGLKRLPPARRRAAEKEIRAKLQKLSVEARIKAIEDKIQNHDRLFRSKLNQGVREVNAGRMDAARALIIDAREAEHQIRGLDEDMQKLSTLLRSLASREVVGKAVG